MSKALAALIEKQFREFPPNKRYERGRPFGAYGCFPGEWQTNQFGVIKGTWHWEEPLGKNRVISLGNQLKVKFLPDDVGKPDCLPQIRDWYESSFEPTAFWTPLQEGKPSGFGVFDANKRLEPQAEQEFEGQQKPSEQKE